MGEDDLAAWKLAQSVVDDEVHGRAARLVRIVEHGLRQRGVDAVRVDRVGGVDEDDGVAPAKLCPDGREGFVAEIVIGVAVAREERDAVCVQIVEGVCDFPERGLRVEDGGERAEEAVAVGVLVAECRAEVVHLAG